MNRPLVLGALAALTFLPLAAYAQVVVTSAPASPQLGVPIFYYPDPDGSGLDTVDHWLLNSSTYVDLLVQDIQNFYGGTVNDIKKAGIHADGGNPADKGDHFSSDRVCADIDSVFGPNPSALTSYEPGDDYTTPGSNSVLRFNYNADSAWSYHSANDMNHHIVGLACQSYALPQNTLTADAKTVNKNYTINPGDSFKLTWDDESTYWNNGYGDNFGHLPPRDLLRNPVQGPPKCPGLPSAYPQDVPYTLCTSDGFALSGTTNTVTYYRYDGETNKCVYNSQYSYFRSDRTGSVVLSPAQTTTYTYTCSSVENGTTRVQLTINVSGSSSLPNYKVPNVPTVSGTIGLGQPITFSDAVNNTGLGDATTSSYMRFQVDVGAPGTAYRDASTVNLDTASAVVIALAAGATSPSVTSPTWSTTTPNTYKFRACADIPPADGKGNVTESNEGDNCGPDGTFTIGTPLEIACSPDKTVVNTGDTVTWTATVTQGGTGTYNYTIQGADGLYGSLDNSTETSFQVPIIYTTPGIKSPNTATVSSGTETINGQDCGSVTVNEGLPDIMASAPTFSPNPPTLGVNTTLGATITNNGTAAAGSTFPDLFELNPGSIPTTFPPYAIVAAASPDLAIGEGEPITGSYTFPTAGLWYVRACGNMDTGGNVPPLTGGVHRELHTDNNCSPDVNGNNGWTAVTVAPLTTCYANPSSVILGNSTNIHWDSPGASSCTLNGSNAGCTRGCSQAETPTAGDIPTAHYQIICSAGGINSPVCNADVAISSPNATITANPARVAKGGTSVITWAATTIRNYSCSVTDSLGHTLASGQADASGNFSLGSPSSQTINQATTYTITCTLGANTVSNSVTVNLTPIFHEF